MKNISILLAIIITGIFGACKDDDTQLPQLSIAAEDIQLLSEAFESQAGDRVVPISTNLAVVKVMSDDSWCIPEVLEQNGFQLRIAVFPNDGFKNRSTNVRVYGKGAEGITIPISQLASHPSLTVAEESVLVEDGNLDFSLHVTCNFDFHIEQSEWVNDNADNTPLVGTKTYRFVVPAIASGTEREGEIRFVPDSAELAEHTVSIPIKQVQSVLYPEVTTFSPASGKRGERVMLAGKNFGTAAELVKVYFNETEANVISVDNEAIAVDIPKVATEDNLDVTQAVCRVKVVIGGEEYLYTDNFIYEKSWWVSTLTGDGTQAFKSGTLDEAEIYARYLSIDAEGTIYATQRDKGNYLARISEKENSVTSLTGSTSLSAWTPNGSCVGNDGALYVANDKQNGRSFYLFPAGNRQPVEHTVEYAPDENVPASSLYTYRILQSPKDHNLYLIAGHNDGPIMEVDLEPKEAGGTVHTGRLVYAWGVNPYMYSASFDPTGDHLYVMVNSASVGYGLYQMDMNNVEAGFSRISDNSQGGAANAETLRDGDLGQATFGQSWDMKFGRDGMLYISDATNHVVRKVDLQNHTVETICGQKGVAGSNDGPAGTATLNAPRGLVWNPQGTVLYIGEFNGARMRKWAFE